MVVEIISSIVKIKSSNIHLLTGKEEVLTPIKSVAEEIWSMEAHYEFQFSHIFQNLVADELSIRWSDGLHSECVGKIIFQFDCVVWLRLIWLERSHFQCWQNQILN